MSTRQYCEDDTIFKQSNGFRADWALLALSHLKPGRLAMHDRQ